MSLSVLEWIPFPVTNKIFEYSSDIPKNGNFVKRILGISSFLTLSKRDKRASIRAWQYAPS